MPLRWVKTEYEFQKGLKSMSGDTLEEETLRGTRKLCEPYSRSGGWQEERSKSIELYIQDSATDLFNTIPN